MIPTTVEGDPGVRSVLDALRDHIAILDDRGTIVGVNDAWRRFATANDLADPAYGVGRDYLAVCEDTADEHARAASAAIRAILAGERREDTLRYPCFGPAGQGGWFEMHAVWSSAGGVVLAHHPIGAAARLGDRSPENLALREALGRADAFQALVGESEAMRRVLHCIEQVAPTDATVLVLGETGTGKELVARAIHAHSARSRRALIKVNCAALPGTLIESELFGHERGAFTGAFARKIGRFELANGGTIFLDEIGDLAPELQAKLLRVLQDGEFERVGSPTTLRTDARVIAATNRDLRSGIETGAFRADLYYRLMVFPIELPPLRERREDIPSLVSHLVAKHEGRMRQRVRRIPQPVMSMLMAYPWPGNVRELENVIERALILSTDGILHVEALDRESTRVAFGAPVSERLDDAERDHIVRVLGECGWRVKGAGSAADRLGLKPSTLRSRMKKLGIVRASRVTANVAPEIRARGGSPST
jgi:transcriptional regulator with GAF, ATPase, and Fis domain